MGIRGRREGVGIRWRREGEEVRGGGKGGIR